MAKGKVYTGTSGWNYKHWKENFYPGDLKQKKWLEFYSERLKSVEINNSFYHLPDTKTLKTWKDITPGNFIFSIKGSRYITHMKKLKAPKTSSRKLFSRIKHLKKKAGPVLFQLPPHWSYNKQRFEKFIKAMPGKYRYAFEFREKSWWNDEVLNLLEKYNAAYCIYELAGTITPKEVTADFVYIRLHGPDGKYQGNYSNRQLSGWAGSISAWQKKNKDVYIYFDNDDSGYAAKNAQQLQKMISS